MLELGLGLGEIECEWWESVDITLCYFLNIEKGDDRNLTLFFFEYIIWNFYKIQK